MPVPTAASPAGFAFSDDPLPVFSVLPGAYLLLLPTLVTEAVNNAVERKVFRSGGMHMRPINPNATASQLPLPHQGIIRDRCNDGIVHVPAQGRAHQQLHEAAHGQQRV